MIAENEIRDANTLGICATLGFGLLARQQARPRGRAARGLPDRLHSCRAMMRRNTCSRSASCSDRSMIVMRASRSAASMLSSSA